MSVPTTAALSHVGRLSTVTELHLASLPNTLRLLQPESPAMFGHLRELSVGSVEIGVATSFFGLCSNTPLIEIHFTFRFCPTVAETDAFYNALRSNCSHTSLNLLALYILEVSPLAGDNSLIPGSSLRTLDCFVNLRTVSLTAPVGFDLDDPTIVQLAAAWPNITSLTLETIISTVPPRITLQCLYSLAQNCPRLCSLRLAFDARSVPAPGPTRVIQDCLESIDVESSPISNATPVARYLSSLFPNLTIIHTDFEEQDNDDPAEVENAAAVQHRLWMQVKDQIPEFVAARREELAFGPSEF